MYKLIIIPALFIISLTSFSQEKATTESGQKVVLMNDGTWKYEQTLENKQTSILLDTPAFSGQIIKEKVPVHTKVELISFAGNSITDTENWLQHNKLVINEYEVSNPMLEKNGNTPKLIPVVYDNKRLVQGFYSDSLSFFVYGNDFASGKILMITDLKGEKVKYILDFENYTYSPKNKPEDLDFVFQRINWAEVKDNILYISHSHPTYATSSFGKNAYIAAIDLNSKQVVWRSQPLVSNCGTFEIVDDIIVCGYGFTAEQDFLYVLNRKTGAVEQKLKLKSGPELIIRKGEQLFVRTYNTDYIFGIIR